MDGGGSFVGCRLRLLSAALVCFFLLSSGLAMMAGCCHGGFRVVSGGRRAGNEVVCATGMAALVCLERLVSGRTWCCCLVDCSLLSYCSSASTLGGGSIGGGRRCRRDEDCSLGTAAVRWLLLVPVMVLWWWA